MGKGEGVTRSGDERGEGGIDREDLWKGEKGKERDGDLKGLREGRERVGVLPCWVYVEYH